MNGVCFIVFLILCMKLNSASVLAQYPEPFETRCSEAVSAKTDSSGICNDPDSGPATAIPESSLQLLYNYKKTHKNKELPPRIPAGNRATPIDVNTKTYVYFFWGKGCPHCAEEKIFLESLKQDLPYLEIKTYEVWHNAEHAAMLSTMLQSQGVPHSGVPVTFVDDRIFSGFSRQTGILIEKAIRECGRKPCRDPAEGFIGPGRREPSRYTMSTVQATTDGRTGTGISIPLIGVIDTHQASLPVLTILIAGMDSFNPCAFFVLFSLLGLLVHARSRNKMLLIGGIFVFFSGFIYFLFMAAWLNLFLFMGHVAVITTVAGCISIVIAGINIKDFYRFKQGISLTMPDSAKPKLFERMRRLLRSSSLVSILIGTTVLAVTANFYELLCTAGFPMVFTRILTLNNLTPTAYYLYLVLYNIVYVIPLFMIVIGFTITLGKRKLSESQGRLLKLISGTMMLGLGIVLLINPVLLNSAWISFLILASSFCFSLLLAAVTRQRGY